MESVSLGAVVARINRKLAHEGEALRKSRGGRALQDLGEFYVLDVNRNRVIEQAVDPESLARKLGVLAAGERVRGG